uniref:Uncharacterized protein n=1 Tax=Entomoneis paludosa TaxID=265537 RepID=A0A7S2YPU6_9STRA
MIDRAVLGVPGTPFAKVMTRSLAFSDYDSLLLMNFKNNRHVRMVIGLVQMAWDSTEGSGFLAEPVNEPSPPILIQAGLGDATVPTGAAEALARGFGARVLPNRPRDIYGLNETVEIRPGNAQMGDVVLTEFLFEKEFAMLPKNDVFGVDNGVHVCLRIDHMAIEQIKVFVTTGEILDICEEDQCIRESIGC